MSSDGFALDHRPISPLGDVGSQTDSERSHGDAPRLRSSRMPGSNQFEELRPRPPSTSRLSQRRHSNAQPGFTDDAPSGIDIPAWVAASGASAFPRVSSPLLSRAPMSPVSTTASSLYAGPTPHTVPSPAARRRPTHQAHVEDVPDDWEHAGVNDGFARHRAAGYDALPTDSRQASPFMTRSVSPSRPHAPPGAHDERERPFVDDSRRRPDDWDRGTHTSYRSDRPDLSNTTHTSLPPDDDNWSQYTGRTDQMPFNPAGGAGFQRQQRMPGANWQRDPWSQRFRPWQNTMQGGFGIVSMMAETFINVVQSIAQIFEKWGESLVSLTRR